MLTIKQITENTNAVIRGLEKKHFKNAKETIDQVIAFNDKRRSTQSILDNNLSEVNSISKSIGQLMKEGKKEEAETAKSRVAELKEVNKTLQTEMDQAAEDMQNLLYTIPNVPYFFPIWLKIPKFPLPVQDSKKFRFLILSVFLFPSPADKTG